MPFDYLSRLTATERTARANRHLGVSLTFVAGGINAGGFLAIGQYTSHMTGIVSSVADNLVLGRISLAAAGLLSLASFVSGASTTAILVNYAKRNARSNIYSTPLLIEASLLLAFGLIGATLQLHELISVSLTAILLCYVMGLQNALITKISNAEIRTTHVTGLMTDVGIELGKLMYWSRQDAHERDAVIRATRKRLALHSSLVSSFFLGGLSGAIAFKYVGFSSTVPLALILVIVSLAPVFNAERPSRRRTHGR